MPTLRRTVLALAVAFGFALPGSAQNNWNQWRGPTRDGYVPPALVPARWPESLELLWRQEVGNGHSSPVIEGGVAFVHTRRGEEEFVSAREMSSGDLRWERAIPTRIGINPYADGHGRWPRSTPLVHDGRLVTLGANATVSVWDAADGALHWRHEQDDGVDTSQLFCGTSVSPMLDDGRLVVHLGDDAGGEVIAFAWEDGEVLWRTPLEGPGYASPILAEFDGDSQLVTLTMSRVVALGRRDGALRWSHPFKDQWNENIVTPIVSHGRVLIAGVRRGTHALAPTRSDDGWRAEVAWSAPHAELYMSSPVLHEGVLYGFSKRRRGQLVAVDVTDGEIIWTHDHAMENASLLRFGPDLVVLGSNGQMTVGPATESGWVESRRYELSENATWASLAPFAGGVLVKDATSLTCWAYEAAPDRSEGD